MKNVIRFLLFIIYSTIIFFLPHNKFILLFIMFNLFVMFINKIRLQKVIIKNIKVLPFIIFTFIINIILDNFSNALWIGIKLFIVCNITIIYSETTSISSIAETIKLICSPLIIFRIDTNDIKVLVCICLSVIPMLKKDLYEVKEACIAKNITFNIQSVKIIFAKFFSSLVVRVNEIEESLIVKGYSNE